VIILWIPYKGTYSQNVYLTPSSLHVKHSDKKYSNFFRNHQSFISTDKKFSWGAAVLIFSCLKGGSTSGEDEESAGEIIGIETKVCTTQSATMSFIWIGMKFSVADPCL